MILSSKVLLQFETFEIQELFSHQKPIEVFQFLFQDSNSHNKFIERGEFLRELKTKFQEKKQVKYSLQSMLILDFLSLNEFKLSDASFKQYLDHLQFPSQNQLPLAIPQNSQNISNRILQFNQLFMAIFVMKEQNGGEEWISPKNRKILIDIFRSYIQYCTVNNYKLDVPLLCSITSWLDPVETDQILQNFLMGLKESNIIKSIKEDIKQLYDRGKYDNFFHRAAKCSQEQLEQSLDFNLSQNSLYLNQSEKDLQQSINDYHGIDWIIDKDQEFEGYLQSGLRIIRKILLSGRVELAVAFNRKKLSKQITQSSKYSDQTLNLTESEADIRIKSLLREQQLISRILDSISEVKNYFSEMVSVL